MGTQATTEQALQVLSDDLTLVASKAEVERKLLAKYGHSAAAESIGKMMLLMWKLFRSCKALHAENVKLREESMALKEVNREAARMKFDPVAKAHLN